jgi:hypothetical protein
VEYLDSLLLFLTSQTCCIHLAIKLTVWPVWNKIMFFVIQLSFSTFETFCEQIYLNFQLKCYISTFMREFGVRTLARRQVILTFFSFFSIPLDKCSENARNITHLLPLSLCGLCHGSVDYFPASHRRGLRSIPGQSMWDMWWKEWH